MTNYNEFQFSVDVPQALIDAGGPLLATDPDYGKTAAIVEIATHEDGTVQTAIISTHSRLDLATKKASKLARDVSKVAGGNAVDYLPVNIELVPRNKTYFGTDGEFGNADDLLIIDTSTWTPRMWQRLQWTRAYSRTLAEHYQAKAHTFEERRDYRLDPVTKSWGYVTVMGCKDCYLEAKDLNL
jgi:hypothetical protein